MSPKNDRTEVRLEPEEKAAFNEAASLAGLSLSTWLRLRLRPIAAQELKQAGRQVPFLKRRKS